MIITKGFKVNHGNITFHQPLPVSGLDYANPFLLLHHHGPLTFHAYNQGLPFSAHPHRGFETVTFIYEGDVVHKDSHGFQSTIYKGGVQWMSAARGIVHSENISAEMREKGGEFEIIQLWVNLPAALKMSPFEYTGIQDAETLKWEESEGKAHIQLISGDWNGKKGPIQSKTNVISANLNLQAGAKLALPNFEKGKVMVYVRKGSLKLENNHLQDRGMAYFDSKQDFVIEAEKDSLALICVAEAIDEPMVSHGPFVMNTTTEIMEAMRDYQMGKMGILTD